MFDNAEVQRCHKPLCLRLFLPLLNTHLMKHRLLYVSILAVAALGLVSCSKELAIDEEESSAAYSSSSTSATGENSLTVKTRSVSTVDGETPEVSLPIYIYVFNTSGKCVGLQTISQAGEAVQFKFKRGSYNIQAVSGTSADAYELPTQASAATDSPVSLKDGQPHGELMVGAAAVKISDGDNNTLTLAMKRKVMQVESVAITGVPTTATGVSVTLAPLYAGINLKGDYTSETGSQTIALSQTSPGTWQSQAAQYMLEASGDATITVSLTTGSETKSYAYYTTDELKANYKLHISGTYNSQEFDLSGTLTGEDWAGTKDISFTFADEEQENPEEPDTTTTPSTPVEDDLVGTLYASKKAFVVSASKNADGSKTYLLMSTTSIKTNSSSTLTQEKAKTLTDGEIRSLSKISNTTGWRLPTKEELLSFKEVRTTYPSNVDSFTYTSGTSYFYQKDDETIAALLIEGETDKDPMKGTIYIRAFTTLTLSE